jgi:hypothetical protein
MNSPGSRYSLVALCFEGSNKHLLWKAVRMTPSREESLSIQFEDLSEIFAM